MKGKTKTPTITHEEVRNSLDYNPATGEFIWKINPAKNVKAGTRAGSKNGGGGYSYITVGGIEVTTSRLAWFYMTGEWPERRVRFVNGDKTDCRFENLTMFNGIGGEYDFKTRQGKIKYLREYRRQTPHIQRAKHLRLMFNMTPEKYDQMLKDQDGGCAICGYPETSTRLGRLKPLAVDHDHKTGKVRALLCESCNTGLGKFKDDVTILLKAADYLRLHSIPGNPDHTDSPG